MRVSRAPKFAGFCGGVKRAWKLAMKVASETEGPVYLSGKLIHNTPAMRELEQLGIRTVDAAGGPPPEGTTIIMRAHGEGPRTFARAQGLGLEVVDATCPIVTVVQKIAVQLENEGFQVVVFGHKQHPEARATVAYTRHGIIIESPEEARSLPHYPKLAAIAQTTMLTSEYQQLCEILKTKADVFENRGRICGWTQHAQTEAVELARQVQAMVVVGGYDSSNTIQLVKVCSDVCPTYHIETADELRPEWFEGIEAVGLAAGASTREYDIAAVIEWLESLDPAVTTVPTVTGASAAERRGAGTLVLDP